MHDIQKIRETPDEVKAGLARRGLDAPVDQIAALDADRRSTLTEVENLKAERNVVSKEIGRMKDPKERQAKIDAMRALGSRVDELDQKVTGIEAELFTILSEIPNIPDPTVPDGPDESANRVVRTVGEKPQYNFKPQPHWDLGPQLGILDFERGAKITGSRFYILSGGGARLQRALISWMLDLHIRQGYREQYPPFMVRGETLFATGHLPKFVDNLYRDAEEDLYMVPTAEVPLTGMHRDEILEKEALPLHYCAYTACFRREKMSAGRDVRGIKRGHQFDKVEMYTYCEPEKSDEELQRMLADAEQTCAELGLTYRVVELCAGDLGFSAQKSFDIEVWAPGCEEWLEVSSISNCGDFQARRANIRYKPEAGGKTIFPHTLNGSGLGMPRALIAVLETFQQEDGSIHVPEVLQPWMGGLDRIAPEE